MGHASGARSILTVPSQWLFAGNEVYFLCAATALAVFLIQLAGAIFAEMAGPIFSAQVPAYCS
jgi:hypothetical protein